MKKKSIQIATFSRYTVKKTTFLGFLNQRAKNILNFSLLLNSFFFYEKFYLAPFLL